MSNDSPQSLILIIESSPQPRLFALIVGIDHYDLDSFPPLRGAVADALAVKTYLEDSLKVPSGQIHTLLNKAATCAAITKAFLSLRDDERIEEGDPVLIYYAGHGAQISSGEVGSKPVQVLVPTDYCMRPEKYVPAIPDCTIGALVAQIAEKKGDNIVRLIFEFSR